MSIEPGSLSGVERLSRIPEGFRIHYGDRTASHQEIERIVEVFRVALSRSNAHGSLIAITGPRGIECVAAMLAVLRIGASFVYIPVTQPEARRNFMIEHSSALVLVSWEISYESGSADPQFLDVVVTETATDRTEVFAEQGYVIFTSGTTGRPKPVFVKFDSLAAMLSGVSTEVPDLAGNWSQFHDPGFDFAMWEIFGSLQFGSALTIFTELEMKDPARLAARVSSRCVAVLSLVPSVFDMFVRLGLPRVHSANLPKTVILGGEALKLSVADSWFSQRDVTKVGLYNLYGITEICVHATIHHVTIDDLSHGTIPIGKSLPQHSVHLHGDGGEHVESPGSVGEIVVCGPYIAEGYLGSAVDSSSFSDCAGVRSYASGDYAYRDESGLLHYVGRRDEQVKIRGVRLELGDVDASLENCPSVNRAASCVLEGNSGGQLGALVVVNGGVELAQVRAEIREFVAGSMFPARLSVVPDIPLTFNGKIDRSAVRERLLQEKR